MAGKEITEIQDGINFLASKISRIEVDNSDMMKLMVQILNNQQVIMKKLGIEDSLTSNNQLKEEKSSDLESYFIK